MGRIGMSHLAGSDSLVTSSVFMKMKERGCMDKYCGVLHGLGSVNKPQQKY